MEDLQEKAMEFHSAWEPGETTGAPLQNTFHYAVC